MTMEQPRAPAGPPTKAKSAMKLSIAIPIIAVLFVGLVVIGLLLFQNMNDLSVAEDKITEHETSIDSLQSDLSNSRAEAVNLTGKLTSCEAEVLSLEDEVVVLEGKIALLEKYTVTSNLLTQKYENTVYDYTIFYPEGWNVDSTDYSIVYITKPNTFVRFSISSDVAVLPIETRVNTFINEVISTRNGVLLMSAKPAVKWDWVLHYRYSYEGKNYEAQAYFLNANNQGKGYLYSYVLCYEASGSNELYKTCQDISLSFIIDLY